MNYSDFSIYNLESSQNLIFNSEENGSIYEVLFSENDDLLATINECNALLIKFDNFKNILTEYRKKIDIVVNHFDVKLKSNNTVFKETSKLVKLTNELTTIKSNKFVTTINKKGPEFITWLKNGLTYEDGNICPYCEKKLTKRRENFISEIIKLTPKNFEIIAKDNHYLEDVGIKTPNYRHSREIERAKKDLIDLYNFREYVNNIIELFDDYRTSKLDINKIKQITISKKFEKLFPDQIETITEINNSLKQIKTKLGKIKKASNKIIKNNKYKVNKYLNLMGIPYEFCESSFDVDKQTASYSLFLKEDEAREDRRNGLSYGEKNIVSLIFFLLGNKNKILLVDDPASSYDEYRRSLMFKMLYEFKNDRTIIMFSHDQVFIKLATFYKYAKNKETKINKFIKENTGIILQYSNYEHKSLLKEIELDDFKPLYNQVVDFIKNKDLSYYRKIINIRILSEIDKKKSLIFKHIYNYCSAILHNVEKNLIYEELKKLSIDEQEILASISDNYSIELELIPDSYFKDFKINELSNFEKIYYFREFLGKLSFIYDSKLLNIKDFKKEDTDLLKTEFDNIVHLNDKLFISLNPYKFDYFSPIIYEIITNDKI